MKCYSGDSVRLRNPYSIEPKKQQHHAEAEDEEQEEAVDSNTIAAQEDPVEPPRTSRDYHDTTALPFPERIRKPV